MHGSVSEASRAAIKAPAQSGNGKSIAAQTVSYQENWFRNAAKAGLGSDPGLALHVLTGIPERSGYRYASGERELPIAVLWHLFQGPHGWTWLSAFMGNSQAQWWIEHQRCLRMAAILIELRERIDALK